MERATISVITLVCALFGNQKGVFGTEVDMRVKAGENITLYSDCVMPLGSQIIWIRNCSHEYQPSLLIDPSNMFLELFPRFRIVHNSSSNSYNLHIENVSVSDEGIYYCAINERNVNIKYKYRNGNRTTHLSVLDSVSTYEKINITSIPPPALDLKLYFILLFSVCSVCVLLFSICVYFLCQKKTGVSASTQTENTFYESEAEVCYASLKKPSMLKKKKPPISDFCIYTEVQTKRKQSMSNP